MTIRVVTDSTCDIPESVAEEYGILVLPAYVNIGNQSYLDGVDLTRQQFYELLPTLDSPPTTAAPAVGTFAQAYERLAKEGADHILSIHLASSLSAIYEVAQLGAQQMDTVEVTVFDSRQLTMGLGLLVLKAARAAASGKSVPEIVALLQQCIRHTHVFAVLDTLEFLRRSGRVSWTEFGLGTLLRIKPIVHVYDGKVEMLERVRTHRRAMEHLIQHVAALGLLEEIALLHTSNPTGVANLRQKAHHLIPARSKPLAVEVTPVIGAHVGPGGLGFACLVADA